MKRRFFWSLTILFCCGLCAAQQVVSSGGYAGKSEASVNWILGGSLSDIPPVDQNTLNRLLKEQMMESEFSLKIYPLPVTDFINIEITPADTGRFMLEIFNNSGIKILADPVVFQPVLQVNVHDIPSGVYYLKVSRPSAKDQLIKIEKIIKL